MSLNTTTDGKQIQTIYVYKHPFLYYDYQFTLCFTTYEKNFIRYVASLSKPNIVEDNIIEIIKIDTSKMTAKPIDDYFKKILFNWPEEKYKKKYSSWRNWIRQYEITE